MFYPSFKNKTKQSKQNKTQRYFCPYLENMGDLQDP
jgi:hypothetical protein